MCVKFAISIGQRLTSEVTLPWRSGCLYLVNAEMVSAVKSTKVLKALRERFEPLFEQYAYLDYLVLFRAVDEEYGPYSTIVEACFDGQVQPLDFSSQEWYEPTKENKELVQFYRKYTKLSIGWNNPIAGDLVRLGSVVIHRDPEQCRQRTEKC